MIIQNDTLMGESKSLEHFTIDCIYTFLRMKIKENKTESIIKRKLGKTFDIRFGNLASETPAKIRSILMNGKQ